jgi:NAD-dependent dihydropyrimidine dehydrogenase PreA subunit
MITPAPSASSAPSTPAAAPEKKAWHGIPRDDIPWLPTVDAESCIGCELCYVTCGRAVFEMRDQVAVAVAPMECAVGCSTCGNVCPTNAIAFPSLDAVWKMERERQIFRTVKKEALRKHEREDTLKARAAAQAAMAHVSTRARVEVAGEFGDKHFLVRLEELIEGKPFDIVKLVLEVPTVKGARQKAPSFMSFEVTSEQQEDIAPFLDVVKKLVHDAGLVLVSTTPL